MAEDKIPYVPSLSLSNDIFCLTKVDLICITQSLKLLYLAHSTWKLMLPYLVVWSYTFCIHCHNPAHLEAIVYIYIYLLKHITIERKDFSIYWHRTTNNTSFTCRIGVHVCAKVYNHRNNLPFLPKLSPKARFTSWPHCNKIVEIHFKLEPEKLCMHPLQYMSFVWG